ncbi:aminoglycoside adenylyltransferase family protein [Micromonospora yasonensis]|uniref:aminoglycoside adenylyltransferase family protein n=1 Tax=Micromonospora yasonensis TaxID=1128667 RepID=UPI002231AED4|nr:aminoglycoside adenylyltransferase family protein [Micromonospora yasonensis]MCW3842509.1 aminoglycoside adenylyltransferase family protein [Micromonospora yasonensis]
MDLDRPALDPVTRAQLQDVLLLVDAVLGAAVLGAYLHGSGVLGGLRPASDVDVFVVSRRRTTAAQRRALVEGLFEISGRRAFRGPARPVELTVVAHPDVQPWRYPPRGEFLYGEWLRDEYAAGGAPEPEETPDLAPLVTMVRRGNTPLAGPPPAELLDPVSAADLARAIVAGIPGLLANLDDDTRNVLLTFARIWTTLATGDIVPKDAAADWALAQLPPEHRPVLAHARAIYLGQAEERWSDELTAQVRPHVDHVLAEIRRLAPTTRG